MNEVVVDAVVTEDEDEVLLLAVVVSEAVAVLVVALVELSDVIDDVLLAVVVVAIVDAEFVVVELVVTVADFEAVVRLDVVPSEVWAAVVVALVDTWVEVAIVLDPSPADGRSVTKITPISRAMKSAAAMGTKVVLPDFTYCSTIDIEARGSKIKPIRQIFDMQTGVSSLAGSESSNQGPLMVDSAAEANEPSHGNHSCPKQNLDSLKYSKRSFDQSVILSPTSGFMNALTSSSGSFIQT